MAIEVATLTQPLPRAELAQFLPNQRAVKSFENMQTDVAITIPEAMAQIVDLTNELLAAPYIAWQASGTLENDRVLNAGQGIAIAVGTSLASVSLTNTGVGTGTYGSASKTVSFTVDGQGRLTAAAEYNLDTDNITEGGANLFYTDARARAAVSGAGIDYDEPTGVFTLTGLNVTGALGYTPFDSAEYSQGTFTPTVIGSSGGSATLSTASGRYTKIGRQVFLQMRVTLSNAAGPTGSIWIGNLPFSALSGAGRIAVSVRAVSGLTGYGTGTLLGTYAQGTVIALCDNSDAGIAVSALTNSTSIDLTCVIDT